MAMNDWIGGDMLTVWQWLGALLGTLLLAAGTLWAGTQLTAQARSFWRAVRGVQPQLVAAVDEATDPLPLQLERVSSVPAAVWAAFLPAFLEALATGLDRALGEGPDVAAE